MHRTNRWIELTIAAGLLLAAGACATRDHLTPSYGRSYRQVFTAQVLNPDAGKTSEAPAGLDSQEAAIVADGYLESLAAEGKASDAKDTKVLMVAPEEGEEK